MSSGLLALGSSGLGGDCPAKPSAKAPSEATVSSRELDALYREHHRFVWRSLARLGVPDDRLGDATHDLFMVVARRLHEFEGKSSMRTWLFAIALRIAQGIRRDAAREHARRESLEAAGQTRSVRTLPHARAEAVRTLRQLLEHLDDGKRAVFIMSELEGMTAPEIARALGLKTATVYSRIRLARCILEREAGRYKITPGRSA